MFLIRAFVDLFYGMFDNGVIHHSIELETWTLKQRETDSTTRCNFEGLRSDIWMVDSRYFILKKRNSILNLSQIIIRGRWLTVTLILYVLDTF